MEKDQGYQEEEPQESYNDGGTLATHPAYAHPFAPGMVIMDQAYKYLVSSE
ncbi:hypothetical protein [Ktedonobacter robiniae]|uniref:Uncharacterized protein n=1 Tax=Ktedonobacter robiniae TaxID=2778365 RepID=A0ABQ3UR35_9CHLR|nr:hypothetical protein [Ktedonobacter robiniae]GHO55170.1 hypothetical protein KSB_36450 [Ktedonobacter robiniae]